MRVLSRPNLARHGPEEDSHTERQRDRHQKCSHVFVFCGNDLWRVTKKVSLVVRCSYYEMWASSHLHTITARERVSA